jgi:hypothetical protein
MEKKEKKQRKENRRKDESRINIELKRGLCNENLVMKIETTYSIRNEGRMAEKKGKEERGKRIERIKT